jgi:hypothetical protein
MARGNARDLTVPASGSHDWQQLSSRMASIHDSSIPLEALEEQVSVVREFARHVERLCREDFARRTSTETDHASVPDLPPKAGP